MMMYIYVLIGLAFLCVGGEVLVRAAVALAGRLNVSPVLIGLTIVAFGTSAPELTVAITAALEGQSGITVGSVVGSNISNIFLVLGVTALIQTLHPARSVILRDGIFMLAVTIAFALVCLTGAITATQGTLFLLLLASYVVFSYWADRRRAYKRNTVDESAQSVEELKGMSQSYLVTLPLLAAGIAGVVFGADLLVEGAVAIAIQFGVSDAVIGLSLVAVGTSLPELAVSIMAAWRGRGDVAIGNILGSNIVNILGILGITSLIVDVEVPAQIVSYDVWVMLLASLVLLPVLLTGKRMVRSEGLVFVGFYGLYITSLFTGLPSFFMSLAG
ncbi:MAG: calcium/sodium antiporter [Parvibaculaceae bacterium]|nr:calcium/sodium antiporter [Parvibaculaceae bacterium]